MNNATVRNSTVVKVIADTLETASDLLLTSNTVSARLTHHAGMLLPGFDINEPDSATPDALPPHMREAIDELITSFNTLPASRRPVIRRVIGRASQTPTVAPDDTAALKARVDNNKQLSERRALAVFTALETGLVEGAMNEANLEGYGERLPYLDYDNTEHVLNRSVELVWELPAPREITVPPSEPSAWGTIQILTSYTLNIVGVILLARGLAKQSLKAFITYEWAGKAVKKLDYLDAKGGVSVGVGSMTHNGETRTVGIAFGVAAIGFKPPTLDAFDFLDVVEAELNPGEDEITSYVDNLTLDDLDGCIFGAVSLTGGGLFLSREGGYMAFISTGDTPGLLAMAHLNGSAANSSGFAPGISANAKQGVIKVYADNEDRTSAEVLFDMASEPSKYLLIVERYLWRSVFE